MQINKIMSASLIDLIFDGRNKAYGAYDLRITYPQRIKRSLLVTGVVLGLAIGGAALANSSKHEDGRYTIKEGMVISEVKDEKKEEKLPDPPKKQPEPEQVKTEKLTDMDIKPDDEVKTPPPSQDDMTDARIDDFKQGGTPDIGVPDEPKAPGGDNGIVEPPKKEFSNEPFTTVEIDAKYTGNWKTFLERNLNPNVPIENNAPPGRYSVVIRFVVDLEGNVSDIQPLTEHGYGMEAEAVRVLKKATKWEPAFQNGYHVKAYKKQVITFEVTDGE